MNQLRTAQQLYVRKEFELALVACLESTRELSAGNHRETCAKRSCYCFPAVCLTIQLFGETNRQKDIIPFCCEWYAHIASIPSYVLSLCLALLARAGLHNEAETLMNTWCAEKNPSQTWSAMENVAEAKDINQVLTTYVRTVLLPQRKFVAVTQILDKMTSYLSSTCLMQLQEENSKHMLLSAKSDGNVCLHSSPSESQHTPEHNGPPSQVLTFFSALYRWMVGKMTNISVANAKTLSPRLVLGLILVAFVLVQKARRSTRTRLALQ